MKIQMGCGFLRFIMIFHLKSLCVIVFSLYLCRTKIEVRLAAIKREWGVSPQLSRSCKFLYRSHAVNPLPLASYL